MSTSQAAGQTQPIGTVTLTAEAPAGGAVVRLESSNTDVAKVPASVTVPAGSTSVNFTVDTSTVPTRTTVTLNAIYLGVQKSTTLAVTLPTPRASFTVTSPDRGSDACMLINLGTALDCRLNGSASEGRLTRWLWTLEAKEKILGDKNEAIFADIDSTCAFVDSLTASTDSNGKYVNMTVSLQVEDRDATRSSTNSRTIKLYTNGNCGF